MFIGWRVIANAPPASRVARVFAGPGCGNAGFLANEPTRRIESGSMSTLVDVQTHGGAIQNGAPPSKERAIHTIMPKASGETSE